MRSLALRPAKGRPGQARRSSSRRQQALSSLKRQLEAQHRRRLPQQGKRRGATRCQCHVPERERMRSQRRGGEGLRPNLRRQSPTVRPEAPCEAAKMHLLHLLLAHPIRHQHQNRHRHHLHWMVLHCLRRRVHRVSLRVTRTPRRNAGGWRQWRRRRNVIQGSNHDAESMSSTSFMSAKSSATAA